MDANENALLAHADAVSRNGALTRRRQRAAYAVFAARQRTKADHALLLAVALAVVLVGVAGRALPPRRPRPENRAQPLSATTRARQFERFYIVHTVTDGDTVWGLALHYYGSPSLAHQKRILDANPWLTNTLDVKIDSKVKIPII